MTDYITINGARKRTFIIFASMPGRIKATAINNDDTRIARNGDTRITRNGDTRVSRSLTPVYTEVRVITSVKKRSFRIQGKVQHG